MYLLDILQDLAKKTNELIIYSKLSHSIILKKDEKKIEIFHHISINFQDIKWHLNKYDVWVLLFAKI